jgi:integrase
MSSLGARSVLGWNAPKRLNFAALRKPKALRHGFAIEVQQRGVPLNIVQRWLGHVRIETTAIYSEILGEEEKLLARRSWETIEANLREAQNDEISVRYGRTINLQISGRPS